MAKISKKPCLFCRTDNCERCCFPCETEEQYKYRLDAELQRRRTQLKYPQIWQREKVIAEGKELRKRRNELNERIKADKR
jgi:hypothetical protein